MKTKENTYSVPGLEKGLVVIELLSKNNTRMSIQEITTQVDVTPTTAYRIMSTLQRLDYVSYNDKHKSYSLTRKMLRLGYQTIGEHDIVEQVLPYIRSLRDRVKESVFFGVLGEEKGVFIEQAQSVHPFKFVLSPGASFELHNSAPGKALMAFSSGLEAQRYIDKIEFTRYTQNTITSRSKYIKELEKIRKNGYATDIEEALIGVICIGAPVFNFEGNPVGAIWVSGPNTRISADIFEMIKKELLETTLSLSQELGYDLNKVVLKK